jgi:radical SAM superfamily enzyme YgiQ (UPF0313 family)
MEGSLKKYLHAPPFLKGKQSMSAKLLLTAVFGPYGVKDAYGEELGCQMELLNNQITREQGVHSPRQSYWSFGLYLMAENVSVETTVLDFPSWKEFTRELKKGYTHVGISFIIPNTLRAKRMAEYIRAHYPDMKIILGGYGTIIEHLREVIPCDEVCHGEGVRWLRNYFGGDLDAPIAHPAIIGPAYEYIYGYKSKPTGGILLPGLGCENGCSFCITSHKFDKCYVPLLRTGKEAFAACRKSEEEKKTMGFSVMDENFLKSVDRARELLVEMETNSRPYVFDLFSSAETVNKVGVDFLVRLGVRMLWIGVESRTNVFSKTNGIDLKALVSELQRKGIVVQASSILFLDHHDQKTIHEDIDWVISLRSDLVQFMNFTPMPTTGAYREYSAQGRMKTLPYRHMHGQGELNFEHPHFKDPKDHVEITRGAFRKKYQAHGPGVLSMAMTAICGYKLARHEFEERQKNSLAWNPQTLRYEITDSPVPDRFMRQRIRMMQRIAIGYRPALLAAWVFAPNRNARKKAQEVMSLYNDTFGKPKAIERLQSVGLVATGSVEMAGIMLAKLRGREGIVRQPPCKRTEYRKSKAPAVPETLGGAADRLAS